jgi:hypothetical protein
MRQACVALHPVGSSPGAPIGSSWLPRSLAVRPLNSPHAIDQSARYSGRYQPSKLLKSSHNRSAAAAHAGEIAV